MVAVQQIVLNAGRLVLGDVLGEGAFGVVLKAEAQGIASDRNAETTVAVKTLKGRPVCLSNASCPMEFLSFRSFDVLL